MTSARTSRMTPTKPAAAVLATLLVLACLVLPAASSVLAQGDATVTAATSAATTIGNYCLECHVTAPATLLDTALPVEWAKDVPCATLRKVQEEAFQTDTLVAGIQNLLPEGSAPLGIDVSAQEKRFAARQLTASAIADTDAVSLAALSAQGKTSRYQLNKIFTALQEARSARQRNIILAFAGAGTAFLLVTLFLGWRNSTKTPGKRKGRTPIVRPALAALAVFVLFASPIFGYVAMDVTSTAAETARQTAVDKAAAVANAASYSSAQAWTLGSIAAKWQAVDPVQASVVFSDAVQASLAKAANATGYWGQEQAVRDNAAAWPETTKDLAAYNAQRVAAFAGKAWELRAVAAEWVGIDKAKAQHLLEQALSQSQKNSDTYLRELDVRAIAVVWAGIDKAGAESLLGTITDPMLRAWGLREIGDTDKAVEAARQIGDAYDRAWSLREIARAAAPASAPAIFAQAQEAAGKVEDATARAYALADLAGAWAKIDAAKGLDIASKIDAANVQAQTVALHAVASASGNKDAYIKALDAASRLGKAYTISKYTANIATDYAAVDANAALDVVGKIGDSFLRDLAYRDIARALAAKDPAATKSIAAKIGSVGMRVQALAAAGAVQEAAALVDSVEDTATLRDVGIAMAKSNPAGAMALLDKIDGNGDRSAVAMAVAMATSDKAQSAEAFARAVREGKLARMTGEPFAVARGLADLAAAYAPLNKSDAAETFTAAVEAAKRVNVKY